MSAPALSPARALLVVGIVLGSLFRLLPALSAGFPTGDGGLILSMVDEIRAAGLGLPELSSYNHLGIPFVYPPLAMLLAAGAGEAGGVGTLDVLRFAPPLIAVASLLALAYAARRVLSPLAAAFAVLAYALMPSAFDSLIAGGGLTRGTGLTLALVGVGLATGEGAHSARRAVAVGASLGLALLAHPQAGAFGVLTAVVLSAERDRRWFASTSLAAASAVAVVAPWLVLIATRGQLADLFAAGQRFEPIVGLIRAMNLEFSAALFMDVFAAAGLLGFVVAVATRSWRLPVLLVGTYLAGAGAAGFLSAVPWALVAGGGVAFVVKSLPGAIPPRPSLAPATIILSTVLLFMAMTASLGAGAGTSSKLNVISPEQRDAMRWVEANTPIDAEFVLATTVVWGDDELSEWFPALTHRSSVATVQGSEWLGRDAFERQLKRHFDVLACARSTASCIGGVAETAAVTPVFVLIPKGRLGGAYSPEDCCPAMRATLADAGFEVVYDGPGATVARSVGS